MDWQTAFNWVGGIATLALGWFSKTVHEDVRAQQRELSQFKEAVAKEHATKDDIKEIREMFHEIMNRLDRKADK